MQYPKLFIFLSILLCFSCKKENKPQALSYVNVNGETMGTTYRITYGDTQERNFKNAIDALLIEVNADVSVYEKDAVISRFNKAGKVFTLSEGEGLHFTNNFKKSVEIYKQSNGAFDPTVMPLVNYWGFGWTEKKAVTKVDSLKVDTLMQLVGFDKIALQSNTLEKEKEGIQLDFGGIAKGYGVDVVCELLEAKGIQNYLVEIGRDSRMKGKNPKGQQWKIGINTPLPGADLSDVEVIVALHNQALASSGNYRNFYEVDGKKYGHTINPSTGFPEKSKLLGASIFANDCATADAYATATMVLGLEKAYALSIATKEIEGLFIYGDESGGLSVKYTPGLEDIIVKD